MGHQANTRHTPDPLKPFELVALMSSSALVMCFMLVSNSGLPEGSDDPEWSVCDLERLD